MCESIYEMDNLTTDEKALFQDNEKVIELLIGPLSLIAKEDMREE